MTHRDGRCVAVTGGTGFVGLALMNALLARGYVVRCISRNPQSADLPRGVLTAGWDELEGTLEGAEALVHLAGAQAVGRRYTASYKKLILDSRVETTKRLVAAMSRLERRPRTFVCASAVGYYGSRPFGRPCDEDAKAGDDFLARVCVQWEQAARSAEPLGVRVVHARIGVVLGDGGPLQVMALPYRCFVGGPIAGGDQAVSWIDRRDAARALTHCLESEGLRGPVNIVAPEATTNDTLGRLIARTLHRPHLLPVPKWALKLLFGEGAEAIAEGQHVAPQRLLSSGFSFDHAELEQVLSDHLG